MTFSDITFGFRPKQKDPEKAKAAKKAKALAKVAKRREQKYVQAHDEVVDTIALRNQVQDKVMENAVTVASQPAVQQVALSLAGKQLNPNAVQQFQRTVTVAAQSPHINPAVITALQNANVSPALAQGVLSGLTEGKAAAANLTPAQYASPAVSAYVSTGQSLLSASPDVAKLAYHQHQLGQQAVRFGREAEKLHDTRLAQLAQKNGTLNQQKKGQVKSGSLQANSPEELAALLSGTVPVSHITKADIQLPIPGVPGLLPGPAPQKLQENINRPAFTGKKSAEAIAKPLTPQEKAIQQLAQRDQRIQALDQQLRQQDPRALQAAIQKRDTAQVAVVKQVGQALISQPAAVLTMATGYLWPQIPKGANAKAPVTPDQIKQAEGTVGHALGRQLADGHVENALQAQIGVEKLHAAGSPIAQDLKDLHQQKIMERDRQMEIDKDGDAFYDAFSELPEIKNAEQAYKRKAIEALPRPEDALYLNPQIPRLVPSTWNEGFRRAYEGTKDF